MESESAIPRSVEEAIAVLESSHYSILENRFDEAMFGNRLIELFNKGTFVRFVRDRLFWSVEISGTGLERWYAPVIWHELIATVPVEDSPSLELQCKLLIADLRIIERLLDSTQNIDASLMAVARHRYDRRQ